MSCFRAPDPLKKDSDPWSFLTQFPLLSKAYSTNPELQEETSECQKLHDGGPPNLLVVGTDQGE